MHLGLRLVPVQVRARAVTRVVKVKARMQIEIGPGISVAAGETKIGIGIIAGDRTTVCIGLSFTILSSHSRIEDHNRYLLHT